MSNDSDYRREQLEFVSNHGGCQIREVMEVIIASAYLILVVETTLVRFENAMSRNVRNIVEFVFLVVPCVFFCTVLFNSGFLVLSAMTTIVILNVAWLGMHITISAKNSAWLDIRPSLTSRIPMVTNFRALTNILTAVCILAVDFRVFPRKFAKTEAYGYSLMDTGVGLFVVANALVSPEARHFGERAKESAHRKMARNLKVCLRSGGPMLLLGLARYLSVEMWGYQKHVTEYGVHWNFFLTLGFAKIITTTIAFVTNCGYNFRLGIFILAMHEYALTVIGLNQWVLGDAPRNGFISANREGIVSLPGFVGLYLLGVGLARIIHSTYGPIKERLKLLCERPPEDFPFTDAQTLGMSDRIYLSLKLFVITILGTVAVYGCSSHFQVSRRLANSGYCFWIFTLSCWLLTVLVWFELLTDFFTQKLTYRLEGLKLVKRTTEDPEMEEKTTAGPGMEKATESPQTMKKQVEFKFDKSATWIRKAPDIFEAVNYNGLVFFLLANLLTGLVNISVKTLYVEDRQALRIIVGYIAVCHFVTVVMYRYKVQLKL